MRPLRSISPANVSGPARPYYTSVFYPEGGPQILPQVKGVDRYNQAQKSFFGQSPADPNPAIVDDRMNILRPNVIQSMLFPETEQMGLGGRRGLQEEIQQANYNARQRLDDPGVDLNEMTGMYPGEYVPGGADSYRQPLLRY